MPRCLIRIFPSFINDTAIDWFFTWPKDALEEVTVTLLEDTKVDGIDLLALARACSQVHLSVIKESRKFSLEAKRTNYVTPTKFLRLVNVRPSMQPFKDCIVCRTEVKISKLFYIFRTALQEYKRMLKDKTKMVHETIQKLSTGLDKLVEARSQVEQMNGELEVKKDDVAKKQRECEQLVVVIEEKRILADEQMKQVLLGLIWIFILIVDRPSPCGTAFAACC